jgi:hypothetical protein
MKDKIIKKIIKKYTDGKVPYLENLLEEAFNEGFEKGKVHALSGLGMIRLKNKKTYGK